MAPQLCRDAEFELAEILVADRRGPLISAKQINRNYILEICKCYACCIKQSQKSFYIGTNWCAPHQVDSKIIYTLCAEFLPAYHNGADRLLYAASRRSWAPMGVRMPDPRWRRRKL